MSKYTSHIIITLIVAVSLLIMTQRAWSHDHADPAHDGWLATLSNQVGGVCCSGDDTTVDPRWEAVVSEDFPYRVMHDGRWVPVSKNSLVKGPNKMGVGLVWFGFSQGEPYVRCFMPGVTA
jgi:hypothetical protein